MLTNVLRISSDNSELDIDVVYDFLHKHAAWSKGIGRETVERAIERSLCFGGYLGQRQVAFARVVTDMATFAYLCDVFVLPEFQTRGYAHALLDHIFGSDLLKGLRRIVLVTSNAHGVYKRHGFTNISHPERYMELYRPNIYSA
ncbi:GNAT family N-acetyltransferase [Paraburkholderia silviterrae]|uniref:N-acetyltransferase n=1 Tax=Paraburkholderia silviterrae TaxID=2528715 RepID=A0A4R5M0I1_9BURK|nr:GNAT family N-acetyltransferase [Paraburkholderia silviterrae]TDG18681.1 N-acetyltransferase [Paraburkholderia silviterrae]